MPTDNTSFHELKHKLQEACAFLHSFTKGHRGFTQRDGLAAISRVSGLCEQMEAAFSSGRHSDEAESVVTASREHIEEAKARLALLRE